MAEIGADTLRRIPGALGGRSPAAADELLARARERLGVRAPRRVVVVAAPPRNAAGKVVKRELVDMIGRAR